MTLNKVTRKKELKSLCKKQSFESQFLLISSTMNLSIIRTNISAYFTHGLKN